MLHDPSINAEENLMWDANPGPPYAELNTGNWWDMVERNSRARENGFHIMPIILYTDGASPDFRRNVSLKPIVVSCGNYKGSVCRSTQGKRCCGFWPKLKVIWP